MQRTSSSTAAQDALDVAVNQVGISSGIDKGGTGTTPPLPPASRGWSTPQVHAHADLVMAVLPTSALAQGALDRLRQAGFGAECCGLIERDGPLTCTRGLLARAGCADDGPRVVLTELGLSDAAAQCYQQAFEDGQTVVAVQAGHRRVEDVVGMLQQVTRTDSLRALIDPEPLEWQLLDRPSAGLERAQCRGEAAAARVS